MGVLEIIVLLLIAGVCGVIAEMIVGFSPGGFLVSILVGLIGAYLGSWLAAAIGLPPVLSVTALGVGGGSFAFDIVWSILGAILLLLLVSLARGVGRRRVAV